jgi:MerR family transcriptional regulator, light-induced transcriptional regulator
MPNRPAFGSVSWPNGPGSVLSCSGRGSSGTGSSSRHGPREAFGCTALPTRPGSSACRALCRAGSPPAQAARLVLSGGEPAPRVPASATTLEDAAGNLSASLDQLDEQAANSALDWLVATYTVETVLQEVVLPYLHRLGERWEAGEVSVAQEHFASNLLRARLLGLAQGWGQGRGPRAILACAPGEQHELGLLVFGVALRRRGWRITYLGTDSPIGAVAGIARSLTPAVVVLVSMNPDNFLDHAREIEKLAKQARS